MAQASIQQYSENSNFIDSLEGEEWRPMTATKQIPVICQTPAYRVDRALEALEAAQTKDARDYAWKRSQPLRDDLKVLYDAGNQDAWQLAKKLHRALYSCQFQLGGNYADPA